MASAQERRRRGLEKEWYNQIKRQLMEMANVNPGDYDPQFGNHAGALGNPPEPIQITGRGGGVSQVKVQRGKHPSDSDVAAYAKSLGGNPYSKSAYGGRGASASKSAVTSSRKNAPNLPKGTRQRFQDEVMARIEEANAANLERYEEAKQGYQDRMDRNMGLLAGQGEYEDALAVREAGEQAGRIRSGLAGRGRGSRAYAYDARIAEGLGMRRAKNRQDTAKMMVNADQSMSEDLLQFIERRTDQAPDYRHAMQSIQQMGEGGDGQGFEQPAIQQPANRGPVQGGYGAPQAGAPVFLGNPYGMQAPQYGPPRTPAQQRAPTGPNRPGQAAWLAKQQAKKKARDERAAGRRKKKAAVKAGTLDEWASYFGEPSAPPKRKPIPDEWESYFGA